MPSPIDHFEINVLNLDRSKDRLMTFAKVNAHLKNVTRVSAADGASLDTLALERAGIISRDLMGRDYYSTGALGAAVSHLAMFDLAVNQNRIITIAEDDAIFNTEFERLAPAMIKALPADWDFVLWGFNFDVFAAFEMIPGVSHCMAQFDEPRMKGATFVHSCASRWN